jgi:hypothetical protein
MPLHRENMDVVALGAFKGRHLPVKVLPGRQALGIDQETDVVVDRPEFVHPNLFGRQLRIRCVHALFRDLVRGPQPTRRDAPSHLVGKNTGSLRKVRRVVVVDAFVGAQKVDEPVRRGGRFASAEPPMSRGSRPRRLSSPAGGPDRRRSRAGSRISESI